MEPAAAVCRTVALNRLKLKYNTRSRFRALPSNTSTAPKAPENSLLLVSTNSRLQEAGRPLEPSRRIQCQKPGVIWTQGVSSHCTQPNQKGAGQRNWKGALNNPKQGPAAQLPRDHRGSVQKPGTREGGMPGWQSWCDSPSLTHRVEMAGVSRQQTAWAPSRRKNLGTAGQVRDGVRDPEQPSQEPRSQTFAFLAAYHY